MNTRYENPEMTKNYLETLIDKGGRLSASSWTKYQKSNSDGVPSLILAQIPEFDDGDGLLFVARDWITVKHFHLHGLQSTHEKEEKEENQRIQGVL